VYYRLEVLPFRVPGLRERSTDIPILARAFVAEFSAEVGDKPKEISERAMEKLVTHSWPGNVCEGVSRRLESLNSEADRG
jgi:DNA-binding NtrC family response regulator